ncbi:MAG: hypothetical protein QOF76_4506 [Solirubrobacteraceae bacterium]|jgi:hypothetical protein|nr:hypothetical protein [Solirubrobacteraceae bacterium]
MELILAIVAAGPIGWFAPDLATARRRYLLLWVAVFPLQTVVVILTDDIDPLYFVLNVPILLLGLTANTCGQYLARRRSGAIAA